MTIKALDTEYAGYLFRSRIEARWAVYFDKMRVSWEYEPTGLDLGSLGWYLPDFYLPAYDAYIEIKPNKSALKEVTEKLVAIEESSANSAWGLFGDPLDHYWLMLTYRYKKHSEGDKKFTIPGWYPEWAEYSAISFHRADDGSIKPAPTFSLSGFLGNHQWRNSVAQRNAIENHKEKTEARQARFEHGKTPSKWKAPERLARIPKLTPQAQELFDGIAQLQKEGFSTIDAVREMGKRLNKVMS